VVIPLEKKNQRGATALEFAILLPVWLMIFFGLLDYAWYMTNVIVLENAVSVGARAGVKFKYWDEADADTPDKIAIEAVRNTFWLNTSIGQDQIEVFIRDKDNQKISVVNADASDYKYLEVRVVKLEYPLIAGYLSSSMLPRTISAVSFMAFP